MQPFRVIVCGSVTLPSSCKGRISSAVQVAKFEGRVTGLYTIWGGGWESCRIWAVDSQQGSPVDTRQHTSVEYNCLGNLVGGS